MFVFFFFFQAEDGIRDVAVTGVQTCALPIYPHIHSASMRLGVYLFAFVARSPSIRALFRLIPHRYPPRSPSALTTRWHGITIAAGLVAHARATARVARGRPMARAISARSEERRVGKEGRSRWSPDH